MTTLSRDQYNDAARAALFDDIAWAQFRAQDEMRALEWLTDTITGIQNQMTARNAEFALWADEDFRPDYTAKKAELARWKRSALHVRRKCEERKRAITHRNRSMDEVRNLENRSAGYHAALLALAVSVEQHQAGHFGDSELYAAYDALTIPTMKGQAMSVRDVLVRIREVEQAEQDGEAMAQEGS